MKVLSKLMGRQPQSQALIKAPNADLIRSDSELVPPEPEEIQIEMEPEMLKSYASMVSSCNLSEQAINREKLLHFLG